jgi:predicted acyl esterase
VCRLDIRGTGSSEGSATGEYTAEELEDLTEVIAWLADRPWSNGNVGMFGTSWSGFNSLQVAMLRPPALKAICSIFASDDRYADDVHYYGGALKQLDLADWPTYMDAINVLPPDPRVCGEGLARRVGTPGRRVRAVAVRLARAPAVRRVLEARVAARGLRRDRSGDDARDRMGRRLHEHRPARHGEPQLPETPPGRVPGRTPTSRPRAPAPTSTSTCEMARWWTDGLGVRTTASTASRRSSCSCGVR